MMRTAIALGAWLATAGLAWALDEDVVQDRILGFVTEGQTCADGTDFWQRKVARNPADGYGVRYSRFGCEPGARGAMVVAPGRGEASVEYYETAIDFIARGFGPIYVIDHRGQGFSPRLLADPDKAHVDRFSDYVADLDAVVEGVRAELADAEARLSFVSNSMGGAIGLGYFQMKGADNPFVAAALTGPMIKVNYISFVDAPQSWLNLRIFSEAGARFQARWRCRVVVLWQPDRCEDYAAPQTFGAYDPSERRFQPDTEAMMTHSEARFDLRSALWDQVDWSAVAAEEYSDDELWVGPHIGGSTNGWVLATTLFNRDMRRTENLEKMQTMPLMILMGTADLRGYRPYRAGLNRPPDLSHAKGLCDDLNAISAREGRYICEFVALEGGFHELFKESDRYRNEALDTVDWFLSRW